MISINLQIFGGRGSASGGGNRAAFSPISKSGLPELKGSEKQVAWAESLRESRVNAVNSELSRLASISSQEDMLDSALGWQSGSALTRAAGALDPTRRWSLSLEMKIAKSGRSNQNLSTKERMTAFAEYTDRIKTGLSEQTKASWWIDNRNR